MKYNFLVIKLLQRRNAIAFKNIVAERGAKPVEQSSGGAVFCLVAADNDITLRGKRIVFG